MLQRAMPNRDTQARILTRHSRPALSHLPPSPAHLACIRRSPFDYIMSAPAYPLDTTAPIEGGNPLLPGETILIGVRSPLEHDLHMPPADDVSEEYRLEVDHALAEAIDLVNDGCVECRGLLRMVRAGPWSHFMPHGTFAPFRRPSFISPFQCTSCAIS